MTQLRLAQRIGALQPTAVNRVLDEVRRVQASGTAVVSLMRGQPDSPTPAHIVEAAQTALKNGRTGYPDNQGEPGLRRAVAGMLQRQHGLTYDPDREVLVTDGATCGIALALGTLIESGDEVLLPDPIYDAYGSVIALFGGRAVGVAAAVIDGGRFAFDRAGLEAALSPRTRGLLLNNPWNPVGTVFTSGELATIVDFAAAHNLFLISDEIYESLIYDGRRSVSSVSLAGARERTILVNSLSKTYSMTGWRVGYCAGPAEVIRGMLLLLQQWSRGPATFVQDAAAAALNGDQACVDAMRKEYEGRRDLVLRQLTGIRGVRPLVPEGGLFVMVDLRELLGNSAHSRTSDDVRRFLLKECGVVVLHGGAYGPGGVGTLRVSFAAGGRTLERGLDLLRGGLERIAAGDWPNDG